MLTTASTPTLGPGVLPFFLLSPHSKITLHGRQVRFQTATKSFILFSLSSGKSPQAVLSVFAHHRSRRKKKKAMWYVSQSVGSLGCGMRRQLQDRALESDCHGSMSHRLHREPCDLRNSDLQSLFYTWEELSWLCQWVYVKIE